MRKPKENTLWHFVWLLTIFLITLSFMEAPLLATGAVAMAMLGMLALAVQAGHRPDGPETLKEWKLKVLLDNRHTARLRWVEPFPGLDPDGEFSDAHVELTATVDDCIKIQRRACHKLVTINMEKDEDRLGDFMAVNWATPVRRSEEYPIKVGDYVLGTRWSDCDPNDPWRVGYVVRIEHTRVGTYYTVGEENGTYKRGDEFQHVRRMTKKEGAEWLEQYDGIL